MAPAADTLVGLSVAGGVATLELRNPPVNALQPQVFESLFFQLRKAQTDPNIRAIVLTGGGGRFCAGFDVTLFGTDAMAGLLDGRQAVLAQLNALLENGAKPTVAAVEGAALGGGCELAMACNARICAAGAQLGLPEVRLGLLPGLGGTQRLPRLVGMEQALDLLLSGQPIAAEEAQVAGLADQVVPPSELLPAAHRLALQIATGSVPRRRTLQLTTHTQLTGEPFAASVQALQEAKASISRRLTGQQQYPLLLEAVAAGLAEGPALGLQREGEGFRAASASRLHRMLLGLFKLDRSLKKARGPAWALGQLRAFFGLLLLVLYMKLLIPYTVLANQASYFANGFSRGYRAKGRPGAEQEGGAAPAAAGAARECSRRPGAARQRRK